ncbi:MAG TPA: hypothetical protein VIA18_08620, partial [Polyangia bacterium]|nr:hypothetical protein [Polyangia bacterium]
TLDATTLAFTTTFANINTTALRDDGVAALMLGNHWLITGGHYNAGGVGGNMFSAAVSYSNVDPATGTIALPVADANSVLASFRADHRLVAVENQIYSIGGSSSGFPADYERSEMR